METDKGSPHNRKDVLTPIPEITWIDETHPRHPFISSPREMRDRFAYLILKRGIDMIIPIGDPAFHHNEARLLETGRRMAEIFHLQGKGDILDVGTGSNYAVSQGIQEVTRCKVNYLDVVFEGAQESNDNLPIQKVKPIGKKCERYQGDLRDIDHPRSPLRNTRFGTIIFNGSWVAGGYNNTVMDMLESRYYQNSQTNGPESIERYRERVITQMLQSAHDHLAKNGTIILTSSRFAWHGAGYNYEGLPDEKLMFLDVVRRARSLGAKRIHVAGVSSDGLRKVVETVIADPLVQKQFEINSSLETWLTPFGDETKYSIEDEKGHVLSSQELKARICSDDDFRRELNELSPAPIPLLVDAQKKVTDELTGGVNALSFKRSRGVLSRENEELTKKDTAAYFPDSIAVIDAIAVEF